MSVVITRHFILLSTKERSLVNPCQKSSATLGGFDQGEFQHDNKADWVSTTTSPAYFC